ncbi:MAG: cadmium-translocating P-type ATPase [Flavobacterium sp.]|nr:cadmium-translocating P-type ATPase [Flavobacterium sp.]
MENINIKHKHTEDKCCASDEKINFNATENHSDDDGHNHGNEDEHQSTFKKYLPATISFLLLVSGIVFEQTKASFFNYPINLIWFAVAYVFVGLPVNLQAFKEIKKGNVFSEFFLMSIATIGAFCINQYSEGVAVMLFYAVGELFQDAAVNNAKRSIKALLDVRPDTVNVIRNGKIKTLNPTEIEIGEIFQVRPGEKVALDGILISEAASFNTSALTGESKPDTKNAAEIVLAGMINLNSVAEIKVTTLYKDSKLSKILEMVQDATARKSQTQLFISKFAKIYTPIVVFLAIAIATLPYFFVSNFIFSDWLYRALVFLVISCPCALVISVPLGYFGGIGLASKNGILFKGSNFLDVMTKITAVVMDKTGTLTKGVFKVQKVVTNNFDEKELIQITSALESKSTHPVAMAIVQYAPDAYKNTTIENVEEIAGHGLKGIVNSKEVLAGNTKLLQKFNISYDRIIEEIVDTIVVVAVNNVYAGYIIIADEIKEDALETIKALHKLNIKTVMLSGDKQSVVDKVAKMLGIDNAFGDLLPENKVEKVQELKNQNYKIAFVGDGVNDAPVVALADAGIAMGGLGSDATIETADIVIQNDQPSKIPVAIQIGKETRKIVMQNIGLAFTVKVIVLILGAGGIATLWEAVFADVGVALLAILNAVRIQKIKFEIKYN